MKRKKTGSKFKKFAKIFVIFCLTSLFLVMSAFFIIYFTGDKIRFDTAKFYQSVSKIDFYDSENRLIDENNSYNISFIKLEALPQHTIDAFISIEDKDFYKHKGLNYKRILKAVMLDLKNMNLAQGASTISQQLIKNTHLSSQKTLSRKVNELFLTKELENKLSKQQILENYLNIIYFGDNCYGIENACWHYFNKSAKELTLEESATLAGLISSPARYSPITKQEACKNRRNIVLAEMKRDSYINDETYKVAKNSDLTLEIKPNAEHLLNTYTEASLDEAMEILKLPAKQISLGGYKIYTYFNKEKQIALQNSLEKSNFEENNFAAISINSKTGFVESFYGNGNYKILNTPRQPASVIKPILVYGPAMNENIISPHTHILDEEISISGYKPKNHDLQYHGYLSVAQAIEQSYNIPAVKVTSYLGLEKAQAYAKKAGIEFDEQDKNYAISLGGFTHGVTLKAITGAYTSFSNNGEYVSPSFISYITDKDGKIVYIAKQEKNNVFRPDTAYLMNKVLINASKVGTSKRLSALPYQVASKTGTVGKLSTNYDALAVSYTTQDILGVWVGNFDNKPIGRIVGGTVPINVTKDYFETIYQNAKPNDFERPESIQDVEIDLKHLSENHQIIMANNFLPEKYKGVYEFSSYNLPKNPNFTHLSLVPSQLDGYVKNSQAVLNFNALDFLRYEIYLNGRLVKLFENQNGNVEFRYDLTNNTPHIFELVTKIKNYKTNEEFEEKSKPIKLVRTAQTDRNNLVQTAKKWYL
jgi:membrane peptidoglycan carboxypeptidase